MMEPDTGKNLIPEKSKTMIPFRELILGKASAELESASNPILLLDGFFDPGKVIDEIKSGSVSFILGYKGSGKSAIGEHLRLASEQQCDSFVTHSFLSDFPYANFASIVTGIAEPESRYPTAWAWILLLYLINSFSRDAGSISHFEPDFVNSCNALRQIGLLPPTSMKKLVIASSKPKIKAKLPPLLQIEYDLNAVPGTDLQFLHLVSHLRDLATDFKSESKHILIIDGLDDILLESAIQYQTLAALVTEVSRLNLQFAKAGCPAKILVLCRTELYERLPAPNKNKIRQDLAFDLDWYHDPRQPRASKLVELANLRARLSDPSISDLFNEYFPEEVKWRGVLSLLFEHTRHTPRDFLQLLVYIQKYSSTGRVNRTQILSALRDYSINYFFPEIRDELVGYIPTLQVETAFKAIGSVGLRDFNYRAVMESS